MTKQRSRPALRTQHNHLPVVIRNRIRAGAVVSTASEGDDCLDPPSRCWGGPHWDATPA